MRGRLALIGVVALVAVLMSSCFALRGFKWSKASVVQGTKVVAILDLRPHGTSGVKDRPFVLIGTQLDSSDETDFNVVNPLKFAVNGTFGGPRELSKDNALRNTALASGGCDIDGFDPGEATGLSWTAVRTGPEVNDKGKIGKSAITKIGIKAHNDASTGTRRFAFISGRWNDDDDGIPESGEISCTGVIVTTLPVRPAAK